MNMNKTIYRIQDRTIYRGIAIIPPEGPVRVRCLSCNDTTSVTNNPFLRCSRCGDPLSYIGPARTDGDSNNG